MTKLCPRGKAAAKRKFKVYPSAYANAYASKICAGKIKDPSDFLFAISTQFSWTHDLNPFLAIMN